MKRRILTTFTLLLVALLTLALVSCGPGGTEETRAEETTAETIEETTKGTMEKTTEDSGYSVIGIESPDRDIIIPAPHEGEPVTGIGDEAFKDCAGLTSITIPDSVASIGRSACSGCKRLTSISFKGTKAQWDAIYKGSYYDFGTGSYTVHCTDGDILLTY